MARGSRADTRQAAHRLIANLPNEAILWVSRRTVKDADLPLPESRHRPPGRVRHLLGQSLDAVVLDLHDGLDGDVLAQCHGFIWGGGHLILRMPPEGRPPEAGQERFAAHPYAPDDVGHRFWQRLERALERANWQRAEELAPLPPADHKVRGTDEQRNVAGRLAALFAEDAPRYAALLADRGRGKSSALGMALRDYLEAADEGADTPRVAVSAGHPDSAAEVFRFATGTSSPPDDGPLRFLRPTELLDAAETSTFDIIVIDEAAQLAVPLLRRLVERHPNAHFAFATTTHGYEGTGRGFELRFLEWLDERDSRLERLTLEEPIRWATDDPLEDFIFDALLLDAEPFSAPDRLGPEDCRHRKLDRDSLASDEDLLHEFFGLLVQAHYRTTPSDLHRLLDAPNLHLHALLADGHVVAATWVAEEGGLTERLCQDIYGGRRIRGHALPETLVSHLGFPEAGRMTMRRSVRIAVHPALRRRGLGTRLVEAVHAHYERETEHADSPDLFGTLFGATPGLLQFRRSVGYGLVRMGASRGRRTGEPSVAMIRPLSEAARRLYERARRELAWKLPLQLELMKAEGDLVFEETLERELCAELPDPEPLPQSRLLQTVRHYAWGPRTHASAAHAIDQFVRDHRDALDTLAPRHRRLVEARILERCSWRATKARADAPSFRMTMRGLRHAIRQLAEHAGLKPPPDG